MAKVYIFNSTKNTSCGYFFVRHPLLDKFRTVDWAKINEELKLIPVFG